MKHLFVPYKLALELKEKGFDEPCFGFWNESYLDLTRFVDKNKELKAPLYQQVIDWLDCKGIYVSITFEEDKKEKGVYNFINIPFYTFEIRRKTHLHGGAIQNYLKFVDYSSDRYSTLNKAIEEAIKLI